MATVALNMPGALSTGDSMALRRCAHLLLRLEDAAPVPVAPAARGRSRSPRRGRRGQLHRQVVPLAAAAPLLFMTELRSLQRRLEAMEELSALAYLSHSALEPVVSVEDLCSGDWMHSLPPDMSIAWLQVTWRPVRAVQKAF